MTDLPADGGAGDDTAGSLLRKARQAQGLHIAALAATIKVAQRKLELLESDRYDELPDATFTRALAQTVCRTLKIDAVPVLARLPQPDAHRLEHVSEGINAPFRDHGRSAPATGWSALLRPAAVIPLLIVLAAAVVYLLPAGALDGIGRAAGPASSPRAAASAGQLVESPGPGTAAPTAAVVAPASAAPAPAVSATAADAAAMPAEAAPPPVTLPATTLQLRALAPSWIEVLDSGGQPLISRIVAAGEVVDLDGALPLKLRIGNVSGTQVAFRGQPVDLALYSRENVARFELK